MDFALHLGTPLLATILVTALLCQLRIGRQRRVSYGAMLLSIGLVAAVWLVAASEGACFTAEFWSFRPKPAPTTLWLQLTALVAVTCAIPSLLVVAWYQQRNRKDGPPLSKTSLPHIDYQPPVRTQVISLVTFLLMVLPSIATACLGYFWFLETVLQLDMNAKPAGIMDMLFMLLMILPMMPAMLMAILLSGIPHMFIMSRLLSWPDLQFYTNQKGPRIPLLSDWLDRLWLQMIEFKRPKSPSGSAS